MTAVAVWMYVGCRKKGQRFDPELFAEKVEWITYGEFGDRLKAFGLCSRLQLVRSLPSLCTMTRGVRVLQADRRARVWAWVHAGRGGLEGARHGLAARQRGQVRRGCCSFLCPLSVLLRKRALWLCVDCRSCMSASLVCVSRDMRRMEMRE